MRLRSQARTRRHGLRRAREGPLCGDVLHGHVCRREWQPPGRLSRLRRGGRRNLPAHRRRGRVPVAGGPMAGPSRAWGPLPWSGPALKWGAFLRLLPFAFIAAGCAHDARFTGTWYRPIPRVLRLEPDGAAIFGASPEQALHRPLARGTWAASDGQILVVIPSEGCANAPNARGGFFSLRFIDGAPPRLRVEIVSLGQCLAFDGMVAEEY